MKTSFFQYNFLELQQLFIANDLAVSGVATLFTWYYKKKRMDPCHKGLAKKTLLFLSSHMNFHLPNIVSVVESEDFTVKFLIKFDDERKVETVLIPFQGKYTACLSSQVGCAMNCSFCYTGTQGLTRNLKTEEIIGQLMVIQKWLNECRPNDNRILNIVLMGQGEPLHNFDAVKKACEILLTRHGLCLADHKITISTSGYIPGLERWKAEMPDVNIALSFHSPIKEKRDELIPLNKRYPLEQVMKLVDAIPQGKKRFVTYEYLLVKNFNDSMEDAHLTGKLLTGKKAFINLIPFNPFPGSNYERPDSEMVNNFKRILDSYKVATTIRTTKGNDILAACGQLNTAKTRI